MKKYVEEEFFKGGWVVNTFCTSNVRGVYTEYYENCLTNLYGIYSNSGEYKNFLVQNRTMILLGAYFYPSTKLYRLNFLDNEGKFYQQIYVKFLPPKNPLVVYGDNLLFYSQIVAERKYLRFFDKYCAINNRFERSTLNYIFTRKIKEDEDREKLVSINNLPKSIRSNLSLKEERNSFPLT